MNDQEILDIRKKMLQEEVDLLEYQEDDLDMDINAKKNWIERMENRLETIRLRLNIARNNLSKLT